MNLLFLCLFCLENNRILPLNMTSPYFFAFRRDVKSSVQRLGQRVKYAWTSRITSRASIGPYRMYVYQSIICLIANLQFEFLSQITQKIMCIRSINNIHQPLLDFFSFKLMFSLKSKNRSTTWKISTVILWTMIRMCENILFLINCNKHLHS